MKKSWAVVLTVTLLLLLLAGCGAKKEEAPTTVEPEKIVIKLGHVEAEDRSTHMAALEFEKYVEQQSNGKVDIEIYPNGQLGGDRQMTEAVTLGTLHMTLPATSVLTT